jgi:hypothetical protein
MLEEATTGAAGGGSSRDSEGGAATSDEDGTEVGSWRGAAGPVSLSPTFVPSTACMNTEASRILTKCTDKKQSDKTQVNAVNRSHGLHSLKKTPRKHRLVTKRHQNRGNNRRDSLSRGGRRQLGSLGLLHRGSATQASRLRKAMVKRSGMCQCREVRQWTKGFKRPPLSAGRPNSGLLAECQTDMLCIPRKYRG